MQHVFGDHIGRTVEAYVDDIVVKTKKADDLVNDLRVTFDYLRANGVKLNPERCLRSAARHATRVHRISVGHRAQHREGLRPRSDGPDSRPKGGAKGVELPGLLEPFHLAAQRKGSAPLPTPEEARALLLDCRGPGVARQAEGDARARVNPHAASKRRASIPLPRGDHPGGRRGHRRGANRARPRPTIPKAVYYISEVLSET
jgi:hypothetical protein